jgi:hypothetical protein
VLLRYAQKLKGAKLAKHRRVYHSGEEAQKRALNISGARLAILTIPRDEHARGSTQQTASHVASNRAMIGVLQAGSTS